MTRQYLTDRERAALLQAQGGLCATWGCISTGPFDADHSTPQVWQKGKPDQLLCKPCHKAKTKLDVGKIAKVRRIRKRAAGETKPKRKIAGRGFDKTKSKKMDGSVVRK